MGMTEIRGASNDKAKARVGLATSVSDLAAASQRGSPDMAELLDEQIMAIVDENHRRTLTRRRFPDWCTRRRRAR